MVVSLLRVMLPERSVCTPLSLSIEAVKCPDVGDASAMDARILLKPSGPSATVSAPKMNEPLGCLVMSASSTVPRMLSTLCRFSRTSFACTIPLSERCSIEPVSSPESSPLP